MTLSTKKLKRLLSSKHDWRGFTTIKSPYFTLYTKIRFFWTIFYFSKIVVFFIYKTATRDCFSRYHEIVVSTWCSFKKVCGEGRIHLLKGSKCRLLVGHISSFSALHAHVIIRLIIFSIQHSRVRTNEYIRYIFLDCREGEKTAPFSPVFTRHFNKTLRLGAACKNITAKRHSVQRSLTNTVSETK